MKLETKMFISSVSSMVVFIILLFKNEPILAILLMPCVILTVISQIDIETTTDKSKGEI